MEDDGSERQRKIVAFPGRRMVRRREAEREDPQSAVSEAASVLQQPTRVLLEEYTSLREGCDPTCLEGSRLARMIEIAVELQRRGELRSLEDRLRRGRLRVLEGGRGGDSGQGS